MCLISDAKQDQACSVLKWETKSLPYIYVLLIIYRISKKMYSRKQSVSSTNGANKTISSCNILKVFFPFSFKILAYKRVLWIDLQMNKTKNKHYTKVKRLMAKEMANRVKQKGENSAGYSLNWLLIPWIH